MEPTKVELDILSAATDLFFEKGFAATSTVDIAKRAGCNQALVHYYYRTKENLFQRIFINELENALSVIGQTMKNELPFEEYLSKAFDIYFYVLMKKPKIAMFLMQELCTNPERRRFIRDNFMKNKMRKLVYKQFVNVVQREISNGKIRAIDPFDLLMDAVALVLSTFLSLPIVSDLLENDEQQQRAFVQRRKEEALTLLINGLRPIQQ